MRWRIHGDPLKTLLIHGQDEVRWLRFVDKLGPIAIHRPDLGRCWFWTGGTNKWGYGKFTAKAKTVSAHRWGYAYFVGPIPEGMDLDHFACDRHICVNPAHVRPATEQENALRSETSVAAINSRKTECVNGHPFDEANTAIRKAGGRRCRACSREIRRRQMARK